MAVPSGESGNVHPVPVEETAAQFFVRPTDYGKEIGLYDMTTDALDLAEAARLYVIYIKREILAVSDLTIISWLLSKEGDNHLLKIREKMGDDFQPVAEIELHMRGTWRCPSCGHLAWDDHRGPCPGCGKIFCRHRIWAPDGQTRLLCNEELSIGHGYKPYLSSTGPESYKEHHAGKVALFCPSHGFIHLCLCGEAMGDITDGQCESILQCIDDDCRIVKLDHLGAGTEYLAPVEIVIDFFKATKQFMAHWAKLMAGDSVSDEELEPAQLLLQSVMERAARFTDYQE